VVARGESDGALAALAPRLAPDAVILLKASRGGALERLVPTRAWAASAPTPARLSGPLRCSSYFLQPLARDVRLFNLLNYITFRRRRARHGARLAFCGPASPPLRADGREPGGARGHGPDTHRRARARHRPWAG
jgi:hypothetical protein